MKTALTAIAIAIFYLLAGIVLAWAIAQDVEPKTEEQAEALAALCVFSTFFWPIILLVIAVFAAAQLFQHRQK